MEEAGLRGSLHAATLLQLARGPPSAPHLAICAAGPATAALVRCAVDSPHLPLPATLVPALRLTPHAPGAKTGRTMGVSLSLGCISSQVRRPGRRGRAAADRMGQGVAGGPVPAFTLRLRPQPNPTHCPAPTPHPHRAHLPHASAVTQVRMPPPPPPAPAVFARQLCSGAELELWYGSVLEAPFCAVTKR